jgi:thiamine-phosphate pyrophosphorylase
MYSSPIIRIIDANLNRLAEGLRMLEELSRMILNDIGLTRQLKTLRHDLIRGDLSFNMELLQSRNSTGDVGVALEVAGETKQKDLPLIAVANSRRAQESLRVLEEMAKLPGVAIRLDSEAFKKARFELYTLEQKLVSLLLRQDKIKKISGLYVVIDTRVLNGRSHVEAARQVINAGVRVIQLRDKTMEKNQLLQLARELQLLCRQNDALFIINDHLDIALAAETDGLHIGQEDLPVEVARRLLPGDKILGCSASTVDEVAAAAAAGADYIGVGAIYPTSSKDNIGVVGLDRVRQIRQSTELPIVAIGGINQTNARAVIEAGADSVCLISAVLNALDITRVVHDLVNIIEAKNENINS